MEVIVLRHLTARNANEVAMQALSLAQLRLEEKREDKVTPVHPPSCRAAAGFRILVDPWGVKDNMHLDLPKPNHVAILECARDIGW